MNLENLARDAGYQGGRLQPNETSDSRNPGVLSTRGDKEFRSQLQAQGFTYQDSIDDRNSGMQALVVKDRNGRNIIIMRGTEPTADGGADLFADLRSNVGVDQYNANRRKLDQWAQQYPGATVTGHSLGAALGQQFIADHPDCVQEGVFFNAPGVGNGVVDKFNRSGSKPPITIYQGSGDPVSEMGGEGHLPSNVVIAHGGNVDPEAEGNGEGAVHSGTMLQPNSGTSLNQADFNEYEGGREPTTAETAPLTNFFDGINIAGENISDFWNWMTGNGQAPRPRGNTETSDNARGGDGRPDGQTAKDAARDTAQSAAQSAARDAARAGRPPVGGPPGGGGPPPGCGGPCR